MALGYAYAWVTIQILILTTDAARIHVLRTHDHVIHKRDVHDHVTAPRERMPHEMVVRVDIDEDQSVNLDLIRNDHVVSLVPVIMGDSGTVKQWQSSNRENYAVYTDKENNAAMFVKSSHESSGTQQHEFMGMFQKGTEEFIVEPSNGGFNQQPDHRPTNHTETLLTPPPGPPPAPPPDSESQRRRTRRRRRHKRALEEGIEAIDYVIKAVDRAAIPYEYETVPLVGERDVFRDEILKIDPPTFDNNQEQFVNYGVESLVVVDYAIYKRYYDRSTSESPDGKKEEAINWIRYYYSHIINGVDLRYMSVQEPDFGLYVRLAGFYIPTTAADSPWTEGVDIRDEDEETGRVYTHAYRALSEFESWINLFKNELPFFDQATLFIGNKLYGGFSKDGVRRNIAGLGEIAGVCTYYRTALVQENGQYATIQTASHEMGHNLGAFHDGSQNSCARTSQYIMAPIPTALTRDNFYNPYKFSSCSVQEFREQIRVMNLRDMNCLKNRAQHIDEEAIDRTLRIPPGQMFSLDEQCMNIFGLASYYCGGGLNDEIMCLELVCYDPYQKRCWKGPERRAATGTTCGNKQWCVQGQCVQEEAAPSAADYCLSGDFRGQFQDSFNCSVIRIQTPYLCYRDHYQRSCCDVCERIFDDSRPECPYGDRQEWCPAISQPDCYDDRQRYDCCSSCERLQTGIPGCAFGSKATWCENDVQANPSICYQSSDICCETCPSYATGPPGCEYGDRTTWCASYTDRPWECYRTIAYQCCGLCERVRQTYGLPDAPDCEFGDHSDKCSPYMCGNRNNWRRCCYTCRHETGYTTRATTISTPPSTTTSTTTITVPTTTPSTTTTTVSTTTTPTTTTTVPTTKTSTSTTTTILPTTTTTKQSSSTTHITTTSSTSTTSSLPSTIIKSHPPTATIPSSTTSRVPSTTIVSPTTTATTPTTTLSTKPISSTAVEVITLADGKPSVTSSVTSFMRPESTAGGATHLLSSLLTSPSSVVMETITTQDTYPCVDRASWCQNISNSYCYSAHEICCDFCDHVRVDIQDCHYGDHYTWCAGIDTADCHYTSYQLDCCITCRDFIPVLNDTTDRLPTTPEVTTTPVADDTCRDDATWCSKVGISYCYTVNETCCARCAPHWTEVPGCEYGDHYSWCNTQELSRCERPEFKKGCCNHCKSWTNEVTMSMPIPPSPVSTLARTPARTTGYTSPTTTPTTVPTSTDSATTETRIPSTNTAPDAERDLYSFCETEIGGSECYFEGYRNGCRQTCQRFRTHIPGCEYGDQNSWCATIDPDLCVYAEYKIPCCLTCLHSDLQTTKSSTMSACSDHAFWCAKIPASNCYVEEDTCCDTCSSYYTGEGGCEFGNRVQWCNDTITHPSDCTRKDIVYNCCKDCNSHGYLLPELDGELAEGTLVEILSTKLELLERQKTLLESIVTILRDFCRQQSTRCCDVFHQTSNVTIRRDDDLITERDVSVATGYPREDIAQLMLNKLLVHVDRERLETYCSGVSGRRERRDIDHPVYFDKTQLQKILSDRKELIEKDTQLTILSIKVPQSMREEVEAPSDRRRILTVAIPACLAVILASLVIVVVVKYCHKFKTVPRVTPSSPKKSDTTSLPRSIPTVYHSNSFTRHHGNNFTCHPSTSGAGRLTRGKTPESLLVDGSTSRAWPETMASMEERTEDLYECWLPNILTSTTELYHSGPLGKPRATGTVVESFDGSWGGDDDDVCILKNNEKGQ